VDRPDFSTRQLRAFVCLAELLNFTRAAQACHLSQPAFSALIRGLEESVGVRLFDRDTRRVRLTVEGKRFEQAARRLLQDTRLALADLADHVERRRGRVHLAALPSLSAGWLPEVFADFRARFPGIELRLSDVLSDPCIELVRSGQADFALASGALPVNGVDGLVSRVLRSDGFHLLCPAGHPLAQQRRLTLASLAGYPFIQMARSTSVRQALDAALHPLSMKTILEVEQLATVGGMVEAGLGISAVPTLTLYQFRSPRIVVRPLPLPTLTRSIVLIRRDASLSSAAQAMHDLVVERFGARPGRETSSDRLG